MNRAETPRIVVAGIVLLTLAIWSVGFMWNRHPPDLSALYLAGYMIAAGTPELVYAAPEGFFGAVPPQWGPALRDLGLDGKEVLAYIYPPIWAALLAPLTEAVGPTSFFRIVAIAEMSMIVVAVFLAWRLCRRWAVSFWIWTLLSATLLASSTISYMALVQLQPQIVVVFLVLLAFERDIAGRPVQAGVVLAVAAMLKLAPAGLVLIFLLDRNWRATGAFTVAFSALAAAGWLMAGPDLHLAFLEALRQAGAGVQITGVTFSAKVPIYAAAAWADAGTAFDWTAGNIRLPETIGWAEAAAKVIGLAGLVWAIRVTSGLARDQRQAARLFLFGLLIGLFGPLGWAHYYLPQLLLLAALPGLIPIRAGIRIMAGFGLALSWPAFVLIGLNVPGDLARATFGSFALIALFVAVTLTLARVAASAASRSQDEADYVDNPTYPCPGAIIRPS